MASANDALFVTSLEKGMRILNAFGEVQTEMGLTGLSRSTGLGMSATQRYANTLLKLGYLHKDPRTKQYSLTLRVLDLAHSYLWSSTLAQLAMPKLIELSNTLSASVNLAAVLDRHRHRLCHSDSILTFEIRRSRHRSAPAGAEHVERSRDDFHAASERSKRRCGNLAAQQSDGKKPRLTARS